MNYKSIELTILLFLLCAVSAFAQPDGFLSFRINGSEIEIVEQSGNISGISLIHTGAFDVTLSDEGTTAYQVVATNDSCPIVYQIKNRAATSFSLILFGLFPGDNPPGPLLFNPDGLCTVTVERMPAE